MPYCVMFEHGLTIGPNGTVRPCCHYRDEKPLKFNDDWKSEHKRLGQLSAIGGWLPGCIECKMKQEEDGIPWSDHYNRKLDDCNDGIAFWDLKINNTCNLACKMCDSWSSSTWHKITKENNLPKDFMDIYGKAPKEKWHRDFDIVFPNLAYAQVVKFTGGEPFMIPQVWKMVEYMVDNDIAKDVEIHFTTNGTINLEDKLSTLKHFKEVSFNISLDAIGKRYEYIRQNAKWNEVETNILALHAATISTNMKVMVNSLHQILNKDHVNEVVDWCAEHGIFWSSCGTCHDPKFMSPDALEDPVLTEKLIRHLKTIDSIHNTNYRRFINA